MKRSPFRVHRGLKQVGPLTAAKVSVKLGSCPTVAAKALQASCNNAQRAATPNWRILENSGHFIPVVHIDHPHCPPFYGPTRVIGDSLLNHAWYWQWDSFKPFGMGRTGISNPGGTSDMLSCSLYGWGPRSIAKLVQITPRTMVDGEYNYSL